MNKLQKIQKKLKITLKTLKNKQNKVKFCNFTKIFIKTYCENRCYIKYYLAKKSLIKKRFFYYIYNRYIFSIFNYY